MKDTNGADTKRLVDERLKTLASVTFQDSTHLIARARFQSALEKVGRDAGVLQLKVSMAEDLIGEGDVRLAKATLEGQYDPRSFVGVLERLASLSQITFVTAAGADMDAANWFRLVIEAPLMLSDSGAAS